MNDNVIRRSGETPSGTARGEGPASSLLAAFDLGASLNRAGWHLRLAVLLGSGDHARAAEDALAEMGDAAISCGASVGAAVAGQRETETVASNWDDWFESDEFVERWDALRQELDVDVEQWKRSGRSGELSDMIETAFRPLLNRADALLVRARKSALSLLAEEASLTAFYLGEKADQGIRPVAAWRTAYTVPATDPSGVASLDPFDSVDFTASNLPSNEADLIAQPGGPGQLPLPPPDNLKPIRITPLLLHRRCIG